ncbi:Carboxylic ester hydrolase [Mycena venus]|uniref:Carboxylic ester hydrolase n=1 Tax=Mycena venus TaxID=2733690 RepID=A0A8H6Y0W6_9AGAR|nr:Carboxylic ester hydrolase [Mycena venus]
MFRKVSLTSLLFLVIQATATPIVQLGGSTVTGSTFDGLEFYGGIPYAEPPIGSLRFKRPVPRGNLGTPTFDASKPGPICLQARIQTNSSAEDCLTLNIYKPAGIPENVTLPVMAWIHGGGWMLGGSASYNATAIVKQSITRGTPIIYVSFNYRLGPLGFPNGREAQSASALNLGLRDQLLALQWIQDNIAVFNGDKSKVTVFGESAGSMSIGILYLNSNLRNLVRAAIFESGSAGGPDTFVASRGQSDWDNFVHAVPDVLLQAVETSWAKSDKGYPFVPVIDGPNGLLPDLPSALMEKGKFARVPFISGANLDEGTYFTRANINSSAMIKSFLFSNYTTPTASAKTLKEAVQKLVQLYPDVPSFGSPFNTGNETFGQSTEWKRYAAIVGDLWIHSQRRAWMQAATRFGVKTFGYLFTDPGAPPIAPPTIGPATAAQGALGVTHTSELIYLYGLNAAFGRPASAIALATQMIDYWVSFTTSLDPNDGLGSNRPTWSQYTSGNQAVLELTSVNMSMIADDYRTQQIDFINSNAAVFARISKEITTKVDAKIDPLPANGGAQGLEEIVKVLDGEGGGLRETLSGLTGGLTGGKTDGV